jgi:hypothetical protein
MSLALLLVVLTVLIVPHLLRRRSTLLE